MQVVWVIEGPYAGKFHPFPDEVAKEMIENGTAQKANGPAHLARKPRYSTREMLSGSDSPASLLLPEQSEQSEQSKFQQAPKKKKKNRK